MISFLDIYDRALKGPLTSERDSDGKPGDAYRRLHDDMVGKLSGMGVPLL